METKRTNTMLLLAASLAVAFTAICGRADDATASEQPNGDKKTVNQMRIFGGFIPDRRQQKGMIYVLNSQVAADSDLLGKALDRFTELVHVDFNVESGAFDVMNPTVKGEATLFVVDNPALPMSLIAPEARWAMMNVAPLKSDKQSFFEARVKKETFRTLAHLLGVASSRYPQCITGCVTKAEDLDDIFEVKMPLEFEQRFEKYLPGLGIVPWKRTTYKRAFQEGWAPAPTNEYQQAIWDKIHTIPDKPLTIDFDPAKDK